MKVVTPIRLVGAAALAVWSVAILLLGLRLASPTVPATTEAGSPAEKPLATVEAPPTEDICPDGSPMLQVGVEDDPCNPSPPEDGGVPACTEPWCYSTSGSTSAGSSSNYYDEDARRRAEREREDAEREREEAERELKEAKRELDDATSYFGDADDDLTPNSRDRCWGIESSC